MSRIDEILARLYVSLGMTKDSQFCEKYDIKPNTLSTWKKREKIPYELIEEISQNENTSLDWLLTGKGEMLIQDKIQTTNSDTYQVSKLSCKASAGTGNNLEGVEEFETGEVLEISKLLFRSTPSSKLRAIQVDGYSMVPMLFPDSWVIFENGGEYKGEGLYIINRDNELMVKLLQINPYGQMLIKSVNLSYESWTVDMNSQIVFNIVGKVVRTII